METTCPTCQSPSLGRAFGTTPNYLRCRQGHVWESPERIKELAALRASVRAAIEASR